MCYAHCAYIQQQKHQQFQNKHRSIDDALFLPLYAMLELIKDEIKTNEMENDESELRQKDFQ